MIEAKVQEQGGESSQNKSQGRPAKTVVLSLIEFRVIFCLCAVVYGGAGKDKGAQFLM